MVARGHVKNGVVVLAGGVRLPEGLEVTVSAPDVSSPGAASASFRGEGPHSVLDISPISLGTIRTPVIDDDDDLLQEMLEGRKI